MDTFKLRTEHREHNEFKGTKRVFELFLELLASMNKTSFPAESS
jgi:hypothetical protein